MKKIGKSHLFAFVLGLVVAGSIGVVASGILAQDITYGNTNVKAALDTLYSKVKPDYTGNTTVTPTNQEQTLFTNNKVLKSNITVGAIPSTYKNLTTSTTVTENNLLNGIKAYDNNGNLITGNISTDCVSGTYNKPANSQWNINLGFIPLKYTLIWNNAQGAVVVNYNQSWSNIYISSLYDSNVLVYNYLTISNNSIVSNFTTSASSYKNSLSIQYMACK